MSVINVTKENFDEEILHSDKPVLVDFWAAWCGPCKMLSPIIDEIAEENDSVKVCKINIDEESELALQYNVMTIPTLLKFENGEISDTSIGYKPKAAVEDFIK